MSDKEAEWDRSERRSTRIAVAIALMPIPVALVISWALGSPPWRAHVAPVVENSSGQIAPASVTPGHGH